VFKGAHYIGSVQSGHADGSDLEIASVVSTALFQNKKTARKVRPRLGLRIDLHESNGATDKAVWTFDLILALQLRHRL
jgi:hypothetical protein